MAVCVSVCLDIQTGEPCKQSLVTLHDFWFNGVKNDAPFTHRPICTFFFFCGFLFFASSFSSSCSPIQILLLFPLPRIFLSRPLLPTPVFPFQCRGLQFLLITLRDTPHSVGLHWTRDRLVAETSTWQQHTTLTRDRHACPRWDFFLLVRGFSPLVHFCTV